MSGVVFVYSLSRRLYVDRDNTEGTSSSKILCLLALSSVYYHCHLHHCIMVVNVLSVVVYVLACRLARTDCKNRQMPKIFILE